MTDFWRYLGTSVAVGGAAGATSLVFLYPFDFARTRVGVDVGVGASRLYTGSIDCIRQVVAAEGWRGVFRGFDASVVGIFAWRGLYFGCYEAATMRLYGHRRGGTLWQRWGLAQAVTTVAGTAVYPLDTVRRRMMMQALQQRAHGSAAVVSGGGAAAANPAVMPAAVVTGEGRAMAHYSSSWQCARALARNEGARGLYRGLSANIIRGFGGAIMLVLFDEIRSFMHGGHA